MSTITRFNANIFKTGNDEEKLNQMDNWLTGNGSSIFVQWIPDEMDEPAVHRFFSTFGYIERVEFVPKFNDDRSKQIGRMLFVHFSQFHSLEIPQKIVKAHPEPEELKWTITNRYGVLKVYTLKCRINTRPIPKVEYTTSQLTDMFENLNTRVFNEMEAMRKQIAELQAALQQQTR